MWTRKWESLSFKVFLKSKCQNVLFSLVSFLSFLPFFHFILFLFSHLCILFLFFYFFSPFISFHLFLPFHLLQFLLPHFDSTSPFSFLHLALPFHFSFTSSSKEIGISRTKGLPGLLVGLRRAQLSVARQMKKKKKKSWLHSWAPRHSHPNFKIGSKESNFLVHTHKNTFPSQQDRRTLGSCCCWVDFDELKKLN